MHPLIDIVTHKHELLAFGSYKPDSWQLLEIARGDRTYRVQVPIIYDNGVERIVRVDDCGALLYLFGEVGHDHRDQGEARLLDCGFPLGGWNVSDARLP